MVYFTKALLVWECKALKLCENGPLHQSVYDDASSNWQSTVKGHSGLQLTFKEDRLPAIVAIVGDEMRVRPNDAYVPGMWKETILTDLL